MHSSPSLDAPASTHRRTGRFRRRLPGSGVGRAAALLCAAALCLAGCHRNQQYSEYGKVWVTITDDESDFTSYIVNIDSLTLLRSDGVSVTALATPETVDFTKLSNYAELWGTATVPIGTYTQATFVVDYTNAVITVEENGKPVLAKVVDDTGAAVTTVTVTINLETNPSYALTIAPTYATTAAQRLALDFNLAASTPVINDSTGVPVVTVRPWVTAAIAPPDNKPIRIRGPLINSNVTLGTYTVYQRPFHDVVDNLGSLTIFTTPKTIFTTNGTVLQGAAGLTQLSQSSAGTTVTAAYCTFQPTATPTATAGIFTALYVIAGSTLEDVYTQGLEGDVVARSGNTLTLQGSTLTQNDGVSTYNVPNWQVLVGPNTLVSADGTLETGLTAADVAVGQHIIARGVPPANATTTTTVLDATGNSATNTGSVRLVPTSLWGILNSTGTGSLSLDLLTVNGLPTRDFDFAGNGTASASDPNISAFIVNTGSIPIPATPPGQLLWIDGNFAPFGSAPPDFNATSVNDELSVQTAGTSAASPTPNSCGQGNFDCIPASLRVSWSLAQVHPFSSLSLIGLTVDLSSPDLTSAVIRIGPESIDMRTLPSSPAIVPTPLPSLVTTNTNTPGSIPVTLPPVFLPEYAFGNPVAVAPAGININSSFAKFAEQMSAQLGVSGAGTIEARGTYNRQTNIFRAISINVVL